jgi:two-component system response regulator YesN
MNSMIKDIHVSEQQVDTYIESSLESRPYLSNLYEYPLLKHLLESGQWDHAEQKLTAIFSELHMNAKVSRDHLLEVYFMCCVSFSYAARQRGEKLESILGNESLTATNSLFDSAYVLERWVYDKLNRIRKLREEYLALPKSDIIQEIQKIVRQNLHDDVSLQLLSEKVHLHPKYLSWLYKNETGEGLSDYINELKMERAVHELKHSRKKVYEIAVHLGYQNTSYFIRVFKGKFHMTPQQFRVRISS